MKVKSAKIINGSLQSAKTGNRSKQIVTVKRGQQVKQNAVKKTKKSKAAKETGFKRVTQGYRAWKKLDVASYRGQGHGSIANLRGNIGLRLLDTRATGQNVFLHKGEHGYGFTWGKQMDTNVMQCGNVQIEFDARNIIARFSTYAEFVKYVQRKGELNVSGVAEWKALSSGARYTLYTNGKQVLRHESAGNASGHFRDYQSEGKTHGKFATGTVKA